MVAVFHIGSIVIGHGALLVDIRRSRLYRYSHGSLFSGQEVCVYGRDYAGHRALTDFAEDNRVKPIP